MSATHIFVYRPLVLSKSLINMRIIAWFVENLHKEVSKWPNRRPRTHTCFCFCILAKIPASLQIVLITSRNEYDGTKTTIPWGASREIFWMTCPTSIICYRPVTQGKEECNHGEQTICLSDRWVCFKIISLSDDPFPTIKQRKFCGGITCPHENVVIRSILAPGKSWLIISENYKKLWAQSYFFF